MPRVQPGMAIALLLWLGCIAGAIAQGVVSVPSDDPEMAQAQAKARATLPEFWRVLERPGPNEAAFALKVALPYGVNNSEHVWCNNVERAGGRIFATVNNAPILAKGVQRGQRIEVEERQISDWMYLRAGKIVGNYTMRPLLHRLPPEEAARYRAMLADP